ncbi:MAG: heme ABC exporter ATP-binding protein CcmA [Dehalococcoidia bacterium]|nr:heme ABC exporter ATP-binding protein CcmA [Dehalococcoidia bacterium]
MDHSGPPTVEVRKLSKDFGGRRALRGVELRAQEGESLAIFGPNGSGKTTLIKILATILRPTGGSVSVAGLSLPQEALEVRRRIGVVTHQNYLYDELTCHENLTFYGRMYRVPDIPERIRTVIAQVGLEARLHDRVRTLSNGMQRRLAIARAVLHNPSVLLLDEPEVGLDEHAVNLLEDLLARLNDGRRTVIMSTHNLERGLRMSDRVAILVDGRIAYQATRGALDVERLRGTYAQLAGARV